MVNLCANWGLAFRPHFKTHQSAEIAEWFRKKGVNKCTVSSIDMAQYFANHGWEDITIAIPVNILEIDKIIELSKIIKLNLLVDQLETCQILSRKVIQPISLFIEIDTGYARSGIAYSQDEQIDTLLHIIKKSPKLQFAGFLSHTGNSYSAENAKMVVQLFEQAKRKMIALKNKYTPHYKNTIISLGDTPSSTYATNFSGIDEWRPGNFIFYDMMQFAQGVCRFDEIALTVRCPIIGIYPQRQEFVIYGGGVHLSKESMNFKGRKIFGWVKIGKEDEGVNKLNGFPVISLSQEHGIIAASSEFLSQLKVGDLIDIIPIHSCMTADLFPQYKTNNNDTISKYRSNST